VYWCCKQSEDALWEPSKISLIHSILDFDFLFNSVLGKKVMVVLCGPYAAPDESSRYISGLMFVLLNDRTWSVRKADLS
jgi:hypothetical protein